MLCSGFIRSLYCQVLLLNVLLISHYFLSNPYNKGSDQNLHGILKLIVTINENYFINRNQTLLNLSMFNIRIN